MARLNVLSTGAEWSDRRWVWQQWCQMGDHSSCHLENACKAVHEGSCLQGRLLPHSPTNVVVILTLSRSTVECRCVHTCKSIHPCSAAYLGSQSQGLKSNHRYPDLPLLGHFLELFLEVHWGHSRDIITLTCPESIKILLPAGHGKNTSLRRCWVCPT